MGRIINFSPKFYGIILLFLLSICLEGCENKEKKVEWMSESNYKLLHKYFDLHNYKQVTQLYDSLKYQNTEIMNREKYLVAQAFSQQNEIDKAIELLLAIEYDISFTNFKFLRYDDLLTPANKSQKWILVIKHFDNLQKEDSTKFSHPCAKILDNIYITDQFYRQKIDNILKAYGSGSEEYISTWRKINTNDSHNVNIVRQILDKYGWLGKNEIGVDRNQTIFLVLMHSHVDIQKQYLPLMRKAVKEKKAQAEDLAYLEDRIKINSGLKQIYGTQFGYDEKTSKYFCLPIEDSTNVDRRRQLISLPPLLEYINKFNL